LLACQTYTTWFFYKWFFKNHAKKNTTRQITTVFIKSATETENEWNCIGKYSIENKNFDHGKRKRQTVKNDW
jgi:hypothetical protein